MPSDPLSMAASDPLSTAAADPLSMAASDPLSMASSSPLGGASKDKKKFDLGTSSSMGHQSSLEEEFEPWSVRKSAILAKYTTSEKLSITASFLSTGDKEKAGMRAQSTVTDKMKSRLDQLDDVEEGSHKETLEMTQQEYVSRIEDLNRALMDAWEQDQRVRALKIAIQCAKMLSDVSVLQFYPSKFVLITDILDTFGRLVFERLYMKAVKHPPGSKLPNRLPDDFNPKDVPDSAVETCRNWFYKIASIRELVARFYVEAAILNSYAFLDAQEHKKALMRMTSMLRGIGDPLVAAYARCYLSRVGVLIAPGFSDYLMPTFDDFLTTYSQLRSDEVQDALAAQRLEQGRYLELFSPALDWLLQMLALRSTPQRLNEVMERCKKQASESALLLNSVISAFSPSFIAERATHFVQLIQSCGDSGFPQHMLHRSLGLCLVLAAPPEDQRLPVLNDVWKVVTKLKIPENYMACAEVWIEYVVQHFGTREVNTILGDIIKHMTPDRAFEDHYPQLLSIATKILVHFTDFSALFALDKFMGFIDLIQKESIKVDVCKTVAESFARNQTEPTKDPVIINTMQYFCKTMHDSVNAMTLDDVRRQISDLISAFVLRVSFGQDFEKQLAFYVDSRAAYTNLDSVIILLVQLVNQLSMNTRRIVRAEHTKRSAAFVRACSAYCYITIPSLNSTTIQLQLNLVSSHVALMNGCLAQADAFLKGTISLLAELSSDVENKLQSEQQLASFVAELFSTLLVIPDNPEQGTLYLIKGALNMLKNYSFERSKDNRALCYTQALGVVAAQAQLRLPYRVHKVDSNDTLYGGDKKFIAELNQIGQVLLDEVLAHLKTLASPELAKRQAHVALQLLEMILSHGDLTHEPLAALAVNLWSLARKSGQCDQKLCQRIHKHVSQTQSRPGFKALLQDMS